MFWSLKVFLERLLMGQQSYHIALLFMLWLLFDKFYHLLT